ncbi:MAG: conjugal transfer protein TraI [Devosia sp. 67-54]|uniref:TrbI/VirB10 family protein n=1 Tax=unclassified Devosia TaxID=196773 RepID=UPI000968C0C3|nr:MULTISPECIES: TrbI/VirB10 family protein [unclassified Devosia]MBN9306969.1 TrbI/VirB10 family protein [Devosia sp.]OJX16942.1 MAG: conjugal transfer protein TraI [Devosia sp. 67-54]
MTDTSIGSDKRASGSASETSANMRLRAEPPRVTRISRRVLIGLGVVAGIGIGGALIYALQTGNRQAAPAELITTDHRQTADGLHNLPTDYTGVPQLGPPLPGDLGGPIVRAQEHGASVPLEPMPLAQPDPEEQKRLAEVEAARTSQVFFQTRLSTTPEVANPRVATINGGLSFESAQTPPPTAQEKQVAFLNADVDRRTVAPDRVTAPASPFVLQAGSVIPAALITGIRSDLPGQVTAQVTQSIYDSPTGSILLIPQGTRIVGEYDNNVGFGQSRVLLVWDRLIFPNGRSIVLERQPGADTQGYAGLEDGVDYHWWDLMRAAGLSTLLAGGAELTTSDTDRLIRAIKGGAANTIADVAQQIIQRQLQVSPTLTVRPGFSVRVIVTRDLVLEPYGATR